MLLARLRSLACVNGRVSPVLRTGSPCFFTRCTPVGLEREPMRRWVKQIDVLAHALDAVTAAPKHHAFLLSHHLITHSLCSATNADVKDRTHYVL